ncbi:metalloprotease mig-17-like [Gigantopelta aegis]|uniref:metalloprotease mig-17-like n=1 Tax=Gigantopelta aegis TaxID=1735272 RepID=UPI001B8895EE|nr:metalloprotease mig-17-like [Gigantopelta aegis]
MAFTGKDMTYGSPSNIGIAYLDSVCSVWAVSVVEDLRNNVVGWIAAHELGHSLNSQHDGDVPSSACDTDGLNVMSYYSPYPTVKSTRQKPWIFSECSVKAFQLKLSQVGCTKNHHTSKSPVLLGQVYNGDQQCQLAFGTNLCRLSKCGRKIIAHEYTSCGNKKAYVSISDVRQCTCHVHESRPTTMMDSCPHHDTATTYTVNLLHAVWSLTFPSASIDTCASTST